MKLLFLGSPGVGKGTYASVLKDVLKIPHISTGDLLRDKLKEGDDLADEIEKIMASGKLVSDDIMIQLIKERVTKKDCANGFILDGFPRTRNQAEQLKDIVEITNVLHFRADDEVIIKRLSGRLVCKDCKSIFHKINIVPKVKGKCDHCKGDLYQRKDDKPESIKKRLKVYTDETAPLIDYYDGQGVLVEIVINKGFGEIKEKLIEKVKAFLEGKIDSIGEI